MADSKTLTATPFVEFRPDEHTAVEKAEGASWPLGGGFYDFGFEVNGAKFVLASLHGGAVEKQFELAKSAKSAEPPPK